MASFGAVAYVAVTAAAVLMSAYVLDINMLLKPSCLYAYGIQLGLCVQCTASRVKSGSVRWIVTSIQRSMGHATEWYTWLLDVRSAVKRIFNSAACGIWDAFVAKASAKALVTKAAAASLKLVSCKWQAALIGINHFLNAVKWSAASSRCAGSTALTLCMTAAQTSYQALLSLPAEGERLCPGLAIMGPVTTTVALYMWLAPEVAMSVCIIATLVLGLDTVPKPSSLTACLGTMSARAHAALSSWILPASRASTLGAESAAAGYQALMSLHARLESLCPGLTIMGPLTVIIMAFVVTYEAQVIQATLAFGVALAVTAALCTEGCNPLAALLEVLTAAAPAAVGAPVRTKRANGAPRGAGPVPRGAHPAGLAHNGRRAAHERRLVLNRVCMRVTHHVG